MDVDVDLERGVGGDGDGEIDRKRTTHLIIEGPGVVMRSNSRNRGVGGIRGAGAEWDGQEEYDLGERRVGGGYSSASGSDSDSDEEEENGYGSEEEGSDIDLEAWPRGIIKTVSVEVVEEVNEEYVAAAAAAAAKNNNANKGGAGMPAGGVVGNAAVGKSTKGIGRNSVIIGPGVVGARRPGMGETAERVSGGSGIEQDWEAMLRAGPPK
jgi:hypothetical protein